MQLTKHKQATKNGDVTKHHLQMKHQIDWDSVTCITYFDLQTISDSLQKAGSGLQIITDMVANATNIFSLATKNSVYLQIYADFCIFSNNQI